MFITLGSFDVRSFCDDVEETSLKMPSRMTAEFEHVRGTYHEAVRIVYVFRALATAHQRLPQGVPST